MQLNRELAAEARRIKLQQLLGVMKNDDLTSEEIDSEVEKVRQLRYEANR